MSRLKLAPIQPAMGVHAWLFWTSHHCCRRWARAWFSVSSRVLKHCTSSCGNGGSVSVGSFLRRGLEGYWEVSEDGEGVEKIGNWSKKSLEAAIFAMHENKQRSIAAVDDLCGLDLDAERVYETFPGDEITIARGYSSVVEHLASVLPVGTVQLGRKVERIEWRANGVDDGSRPVKLHFADGSTVLADHVVVTVSLGVLKLGICEGCELFSPPLPGLKIGAISRLGYGVLDKVFLHYDRKTSGLMEFPCLHMVFHKPDSEFKDPQIPNWMRGSSLLYPVYRDSGAVLSWFAGREALGVEALTEDEIADGFSTTLSDLLPSKLCNGKRLKFEKVLRTQWGTNPLFLGSFSYVAVGSSGDDMDALAEPLPDNSNSNSSPKLQILFAGEATHRKHYSTTHGAYLSGLREANRLLEHYGCIDV